MARMGKAPPPKELLRKNNGKLPRLTRGLHEGTDERPPPSIRYVPMLVLRMFMRETPSGEM